MPGMDALLHQFSTNQFFSATVMGGAILGLLAYFRSMPSTIYHFIVARTTVSLNFNSTDQMYYYLQKWISEKAKFDKFQKDYNVVSRRHQEGTPNVEDGEEHIAPAFLLAPWNGTYIVKYARKWMKISCTRTDPTQAKGGTGTWVYESVRISYLGRSTKHANNFLEEIRALYSEDRKKGVNVYIPSRTGGYWAEHNKLLKRSLDSLVCRDDMIATLVADIAQFSKTDTEQWYIKMGIPYHRGYLFQGPPGTGKTTAVYTLASHFNKNVCFMSISPNISDEDFFGLISNIEPNSIFVMEDIDCLFDIDRNKKDDTKLSFSSMLNGLDGFCSKHGSIVIMTTNHPERLNEALVRKGRVDKVVDFRLCNLAQIERLFLKFFPDRIILAKQFAGCFKDDVFSPVEIQNYLIDNNEPNAALANVEAFIQTKENDERKKIKIVA